jgi:hypothetical protein
VHSPCDAASGTLESPPDRAPILIWSGLGRGHFLLSSDSSWLAMSCRFFGS